MRRSAGAGPHSFLVVAFIVFATTASRARAGDHYALVITGASGGDVYAEKYDKWRSSFVATLRERLGYPDDHILVLAEKESTGVRKATRENVQRVAVDLQKRLSRDDQLLVLLIGHGTSVDADDAKFNLVGPDLRASEWAELLKPIPGSLVFIDTSGGSFPFLRRIAGHGRVVLTATDSPAQLFETVFAEFFVKAFDDPAADLDKNGRVSVWEAFSYASAGVRQWFDQRGQLPTERPLLDDTGEGIGREAQNPGADGALARTTYLEADARATNAHATPGAGTPGTPGAPGASGVPGVPEATTSPAMVALLKRRAELEAAIEALKARKSSIPEDQYAAELEKLALELAKISRLLRAKS